ncbi:MAG: nicotinate-nucleotide adenylyltransferase [Clostridiales bacterium]|nr:nicotinate-nucleotide adenylyltransferase [Clostridiales bacterium]
MAEKEKRVGIFGGTFNPIHNGHLLIAKNACEQFCLEKIIFLPTGHAPHKAFMGEDMCLHRRKMTELAIAPYPIFELSLREMNRTTVNYTYRTLHELNAEYSDTQFYFILGADSLFDFQLWRHPELICQEAVILAAVRDDFDEEKVDAQIAFLSEKYNGKIHRIRTRNYKVSSREIRERICSGKNVRGMLPDSVLEYIQDNRLYKRPENTVSSEQ